jgi:hypothetical protein
VHRGDDFNVIAERFLPLPASQASLAAAEFLAVLHNNTRIHRNRYFAFSRLDFTQLAEYSQQYTGVAVGADTPARDPAPRVNRACSCAGSRAAA